MHSCACYCCADSLHSAHSNLDYDPDPPSEDKVAWWFRDGVAQQGGLAEYEQLEHPHGGAQQSCPKALLISNLGGLRRTTVDTNADTAIIVRL